MLDCLGPVSQRVEWTWTCGQSESEATKQQHTLKDCIIISKCQLTWPQSTNAWKRSKCGKKAIINLIIFLQQEQAMILLCTPLYPTPESHSFSFSFFYAKTSPQTFADASSSHLYLFTPFT